MNNKKMKIEISDDDFMKKTVKEQNLIMFRKVSNIDQHGCSWAKNNKKKQDKKVYGIAATSGFAGGFSAILVKLGIWKDV